MIMLLLFLVLQLARAHVCILDPPQRGSLSVDVPGDPSCYRRTGPCGGVKQTFPGTALLRGATSSIVVQQNLNHWVPPTQNRTSGFFEIKLVQASSAGTDVLLDTWSDFPAWDEVSQTNFTREITIPADVPLGAHVLSFAYVSYNKDEIDPATNTDAVFYNCADVEVVSNTSATTRVPNTTPDKPQKPSESSTAFTCTTPDLWSAHGIETTSHGDFLEHYIVVDNVQQQIYWSRESTGQNIQSFPTVTTITNFTSSREYVLTDGGTKCAIYGPDQFYRLSFGGAAFGMTGGTEIIAKGNSKSNDPQSVYGFSGFPLANGITWTAQVMAQVTATEAGPFCLPLSRVTPSSSLQWIDAKQLEVIPSGQFTMPSVCNKVEVKLDQMLVKNGGRNKSIPGCGYID
jgi:hypothetical protein